LKRGIISDVKVYPIEIPLYRTFATSMAKQNTGRFVIVEVCADGLSGFGEADPRPHITGETIYSSVSILKNYLIPAILGKSFYDLENIHQALEVVKFNTTAKSAIDIAVFDLMGKTLNIPLYNLLGGNKGKAVKLNAWAGIENEPNKVIDTIINKIERGFNHAIKIKVGKNNFYSEVKLLKQLTKLIPENIDVIIDANQAWSYLFAKTHLMKFIDCGVTIVEQPVRYDDLEGMQKLTQKMPVEIMADESLCSANDAFNMASKGIASMFNIKLLKCGGLYPAKKLLGIAESAGISCMVGSTVQTSISAAAQAHIAAASNVIEFADILVPNEFLVTDIANGFKVNKGSVNFSDKPGLGLEVDMKLINKFLMEVKYDNDWLSRKNTQSQS